VASAEEHAVTVLSAVLPNRRDNLAKALRQLTPAHFPERTQSVMFQIFQRYYDTTGGVLSLTALEDSLRGKVDPGQAELYYESYQLYASRQVQDDEFIWSIQQLKELATEKATSAALLEGMKILREGVADERTGETIQGQQAAREYLLEQFSTIDRDLAAQEAPEGDMREERVEMLADYAERKAARLNGTSSGIRFGITGLDAKIGGMQNGEMVLVAGYSSDGKSTLCVQAAWSAAIEQGKNVVFFTTETTRVQIRRKLIARHSMLPQFGLPQGLNNKDLKSGTLPDNSEEKLKEVLMDFERNPAYGRLVIAQVPRSGTVATLEQRLYRFQRQFQVDLVVMDYAALLTSDRKRQTSREELQGIMKECKLLATTFDDGRGVPFMSPWQVTRQARENAEKLGQYTSGSLAETAESTNSADIIVSMLAPTENTERRTEVTMQILKNRDGETENGLVTAVDYATSWFASRDGFEPAAGAASWTPPPGVGGLEDLI
jgi:replicative DNA helicase